MKKITNLKKYEAAFRLALGLTLTGLATNPMVVYADEVVYEVTEENQIEKDTEDIHNEPVDDYAEIDNLDNNVSKENIDYLTKDAESTQDVTMNSNLKQDIKSVLLYMDQLLENLPEDKIIEFAKSEEFTTYKKLFNELGLS